MPIAGNYGLAYFAGNSHWGISEPACFPGEDRRHAALRHAGFVVNDYTELLHFYGFKDPINERIANHRFREHMGKHPHLLAKKVFLNALGILFSGCLLLVSPKWNLRSICSITRCA